jgi:beta-glucosidase
VLLQNDGIPPLLPFTSPSSGGPATIAVVGPVSNCSGCSIGRYTGSPVASTTVWQGVAAAAAARGVTAVFGGEAMDDAAVAAVKSANAAVVVLTGESEGESRDREALGLPADQAAFLARLVAETSTPLVLLTISGGAVDVSPAVSNPRVPAILALYSGGMEAGAAAADVLFGVVNPSGALAHTVYRAAWAEPGGADFLSMDIRSGLGRGHRYLTPYAATKYVLYPFGYGLSYTTWEAFLEPFSPAQISVAALTSGATVQAVLQVYNMGSERDGARVVIAYVSRINAPAAEQWPVQWLPERGFTKVFVPAGGPPANVTLTLVARDFSRWDSAAHAWVVQPGTYNVGVRDGAVSQHVTVVP